MLSSAFVPCLKCLHHNQTPIPRFSTLSLIIPLKRSTSRSLHQSAAYATLNFYSLIMTLPRHSRDRQRNICTLVL